jgi:catechol-2,3-dioxygenase
MRFGHVVLRTTQIEAMTAWYCAVLAARVVERSEQMTFLSWDDAHHRVALVATEEPATSSPLAHVAFELDTVAEFEATRAILTARGIRAHRTVDHAFTWSLYYRDPDGNEVELFVETPLR